MRVVVTVTREYEMDENLLLNQPRFKPPSIDAAPQEKRRWLRESFYELCGFDRDQDHLDGSFVQNTDEIGDTEFDWPEHLRG
jgi:hypothetical protein